MRVSLEVRRADRSLKVEARCADKQREAQRYHRNHDSREIEN